MSANGTAPQHKYLRPEDLAKLGSFEFAPKLLVEGYLSGRHKSRVRGSSVEFHDYRQYVAGDDLAMVDWRVYARTDRHYLRTFEQETNLECHILLDSSASMGYGERISKLDYASFFAAALAYLVYRQRDRVSLLTFDAQIRSFAPPSSTMRHINEMLHLLENNAPGAKTSLAATLKKAGPLLKRKGTLVIISDFFDDPGAIFSALGLYLHRGFRVHLFHILDPAELELPGEGLLNYVDMESRHRTIAHAGEIRRAYQAAIGQHIENLRRLAATKQVDYALARTDLPFFNLFDHLCDRR